jgi:hypothetical protein
MEAAIADARKRGRSIAIATGLALLAVGSCLLLTSIFCSLFEFGPCFRVKDSLDRMAYVGILCVFIFCCAPCFAFTEEEMKKVSLFKIFLSQHT